MKIKLFLRKDKHSSIVTNVIEESMPTDAKIQHIGASVIVIDSDG